MLYEVITDDQDTKSLQAELARASQSQLDTRLTDLLSKLQAAQNDLGTVNSQLTFLQTLPERAQSQMSQDYQRMQDIRNQLSGISSKHTAETTPSARIRLNTELTLLQLRQDQRQKDLDNNTRITSYNVCYTKLLRTNPIFKAYTSKVYHLSLGQSQFQR